MKKRTGIYPQLTIPFIGAVLLTIILMYRVGEIAGMSMGDEFGFVSVGAWISGFDWSEQISNIGYYGFGMGLFFVPGFWISTSLNQFMTYVEILNIIFLLLSYFICVYLLKQILIKKSIVYISVISFISISYLSNLCQRYYAWSETINVLLYWVNLLLIYQLVKKPRAWYFVALGFLETYMIMVHMRNITLVIAGVVTIIYVCVINKEFIKIYVNYILCWIMTVAMGTMVFFATKSYFKNNMWKNSFTAEVNDISSTLGLYAYIIGQDDIVEILLQSSFCKFFYILIATLFLILAGLYFSVQYIKKEKKEFSNKAVIFLALCSFFFSFGLTVFAARHGGRYDIDFYARYYEHTLGFLLAIGVIGIIESSVNNILKIIVCGLILYKVTAITAINTWSSAINDSNIWAICDQNINAFIKHIINDDIPNMVTNVMRNSFTLIFFFAVLIIFFKCIGNIGKINNSIIIEFIILIFIST